MSNLNRFRNLSALLLSAAALSGCIAYGGAGIDPYRYPQPVRPYNIPEGHMPPPGECRVWFPDRPPGQQPPPGKCHDLERRVPPGAVLVRG